MRRRDWEAALVRLADGLVGESFVWGETDCWTLTQRCAHAMCGAAPVMPQYRSRQEAAAVLEHIMPFQALVHFGASQIPVSNAGPGDILEGWLAELGLPAFHVVIGCHALSADIVRGVVLLPIGPVRDACTRAWRLP